MFKKIIIVILFLAVAGAGAFGTYHFYKENKNQIEQSALLMQQNSQIQAQLNAIGTMTTVYEVVNKVYGGAMIKDTDLIEVSVPTSTIFDSSITDKNDLVGKYYKINIEPGTILSKDLLMSETDDSEMKFMRELEFEALPVALVVGDYVDIRFALPNGEEYVVLNHKKVERLYDNIISFKVSEEENYVLDSALADVGTYPNVCCLYIMKYLNPGTDNSIAYYPVTDTVANWVKYDPNIEDTTRCINENLRAHIDEVFIYYGTGNNSAVSEAWIESFKTQLASGDTMHQAWIDAHTDEDGNLNADIPADWEAEGGTGNTFDQQVGEAMDNLEQDLEDLGGIY